MTTFEQFLAQQSTLPGPIGDFGKRVALSHVSPPAYPGRRGWSRLIDRKLGVGYRGEFVAAWRAWKQTEITTEVTHG
jgi:hypothetical protein